MEKHLGEHLQFEQTSLLPLFTVSPRKALNQFDYLSVTLRLALGVYQRQKVVKTVLDDFLLLEVVLDEFDQELHSARQGVVLYLLQDLVAKVY